MRGAWLLLESAHCSDPGLGPRLVRARVPNDHQYRAALNSAGKREPGVATWHETLSRLRARVLVLVPQDRENPESSSSPERKASRSKLVVVTAFWAIIADKVFSAVRRRRKRIRQAEKEELERYRDA